jgi:hypothetical protein
MREDTVRGSHRDLRWVGLDGYSLDRHAIRDNRIAL